MGKTLDDLNLPDAPIRTPAAVDPRETEWYRFVRDIDDLLATGQYTWAEQTLTDIQKTVETTERVTEGQRKAVGNIEAGAYKTKRRYDGYRGRLR